MDMTIEDLFRIIGKKQVEIELLREKMTQMASELRRAQEAAAQNEEPNPDGDQRD